MLSIDDYINTARDVVGAKSDTELAQKHLGINQSSVSFWRKRKSTPSDDLMAKLAELAKMDAQLALLHLSWWRCVSRDEHLAATYYQTMISEYEKQAA